MRTLDLYTHSELGLKSFRGSNEVLAGWGLATDKAQMQQNIVSQDCAPLVIWGA